jgi:hypothetical protein
MAQCTECSSTYQVGAAFCPNCGTQTKPPKSISYASSIMLGIGLLALVLFWQTASIPTPANTARIVSHPLPPDEAAMIITACGKPDADENDAPRPDPNRRWLIYRKARVRTMFVRPSANVPWKREAMLDSKTLRPLAPEVLTKRLPCAVLNGR